jgi:hypothetical protein
MVKPAELRIGNLLLWNPKLKQLQSTLGVLQVAVTAVMADKIGYTFPNLDHRVEPFEDDLMQTENRIKNIEELEPIKLTQNILDKCSFNSAAENFKKENLKVTGEKIMYNYHSIKLEIKYVHQLQNLYFDLTGEELDINF